MTFSTGIRVTDRPSLAVALIPAWRTWHEHDPLLPTRPAEAEGDRSRVDRVRR